MSVYTVPNAPRIVFDHKGNIRLDLCKTERDRECGIDWFNKCEPDQRKHLILLSTWRYHFQTRKLVGVRFK